MSAFAAAVVRWQKKHGRHNLPWQKNGDVYKILLAEVMLQQTQVATVIPYYEKFLSRFPSVQKLAAAKNDSVLSAWSGLGYYARARNLHQAAKLIAKNGFPNSPQEWRQLPGVGKSTAAAICVFSQKKRVAILDGNVKRVVARVFAFAKPVNDKKAEDELWAMAESLLPQKNIIPYTQGLMDLGASICARNNPQCLRCPVQKMCAANLANRQHLFPLRNKQKTKPRKKTVMVAVWREQKILLQKRPPHGIWGGLWSLPESPTIAAAKADGELSVLQKTIFNHEFTHYKLTATVLHCAAKIAPAAQKEYKWFSPAALKNAALPAPIKKVLNI